jgi:hypothetical protein
MIIKSKANIREFLDSFEDFSQWDGTKHYFLFHDGLPDGFITLMKYPEGSFTIYQKNKYFWDTKEQPHSIGELLSKLWYYRKRMNESLKEYNKEEKKI